MITSLEFENFRLFTKLKMAPCKRVNLITGANNTGKTCMLEALCLLFIGDAIQLSQLPSLFRSNVLGSAVQSSSDDYYTFWQSLFFDKQMDQAAKILARTDSNTNLICELQTRRSQPIQLFHDKLKDTAVDPIDMAVAIAQGSDAKERRRSFAVVLGPGNKAGANTGAGNPFAAEFIALSTRMDLPTDAADLYNSVTLLAAGEERLLQLLRQVDPRLNKLRYAKLPGTTVPLVYAYFDQQNALSMNQTGQGFNKLFSLFCKMLAKKGRLLFMDEVENGLFYLTLPEIWKGIAALAVSQDIQVFATTHSQECIVAAHETFKATGNYDFALHRLQRVKGNLEVITHDQGMLEAAVKTGLEVR